MNKTFWAGIVTALSGIAGFFGIDLSMQDLQILADAACGIVAGAGVLASVWAMWKGRKTQKTE